MKNFFVFLKYYGILFLWLGIIFYFSSLSGTPGNVHQGREYLWFYLERKGAHIFEYFVLAMLWIRVLRFHGVKGYWFWAKVLIFPLAYSFSDEFHQTFVFGREGKLTDIVFDAAGIVAALAIWKKFPKFPFF